MKVPEFRRSLLGAGGVGGGGFLSWLLGLQGF